MGDCYQVIADLDAKLEEAEVVASRLREWMIAQEIIIPAKTDCVLSETHGHAPGKNYAKAVKKESPFLFRLKTNGVHIISERTVFYAAGDKITLVCSACGARFKSNDAWSEAVDDWYKAGGVGAYPCEVCGVKEPIT